MSREELDEIKDVMPSILQGVSCKFLFLYFSVFSVRLIFSVVLFLFFLLAGRLESPNHLVRRMASSVALVFSKVIDPKNLLYLDDSCGGETIDWEFGLIDSEKGPQTTSNCIENGVEVKSSISSTVEKDVNDTADEDVLKNVKSKTKRVSEYTLVDPDEIVDPVTLDCYSGSDKDDDDNASENSDTSSDSSLQPYDLADDDTDLKRKFAQLVDVVGALRKSDDADGVSDQIAFFNVVSYLLF